MFLERCHGNHHSVTQIFDRRRRRGTPRPRPRISNLVIALFALSLSLVGGSVRADVVEMKDGRRFEGKLLRDDKHSVQIDTVIATIRVTLELQKNQIGETRQQKLPDGFFDRQPDVGKQSDTALPPVDGTPYLEVPIAGTFGKDILAAGVEKSLRYAIANGVTHIVFTVDSRGGDVDAAREVSRLLEKYDPKLTYHAIVNRATGVAMAVPVWCDSIHMRPAASMGGVVLIFDEEGDESGETETVSAIAARGASIAASRGLPGLVVAAMILPEETVAVWKDSDGKVHIAPQLPASVPMDRIILQDTPHRRVMLNQQQAVAIGMADVFDGSADELGSALEIADWSQASSYGIAAMQSAANQQRIREQREQASALKHDRDVKRNLTRYEELRKYIVATLEEYERTDPRKGKYSTYKAHHSYRGRYYRYYDRYYDTGIFTDRSKREWLYRTDRSINLLLSVRRAIREIRRLEVQAKQLGIVYRTHEFLGDSGVSGTDIDSTKQPQQTKPLDLDNLYRWCARMIERLQHERIRISR